jgi:Protein of unknown function (DUF4435)
MGRGKEDFKKYLPFADKQLIFCRDADYDYLTENPILEKPFVFYTYVYNLESCWSYADGLKKMLENIVNTEGVDFDFEIFFRTYSETVYDWLTYSLYSCKIGDGLLPPKKCGAEIGFTNLKNVEIDLESLKRQLDNRSLVFKNKYAHLPDFQNFKNRLTALGLHPQNAYLFLNGHDVFERVTLKLIKFVGYNTAQKAFDLLRTLGKTKEIKVISKRLTLENYKNQLIKQNHSFQNSLFFEKIVSDFKTAFN